MLADDQSVPSHRASYYHGLVGNLAGALVSRVVDALAEEVPKGFREGTDRAVDPTTTLERARRWFGPMGITRVANITGLDRIGIPVVMVVRPNARSLSVAQGKGIDLPAATASGVMESIEGYHAEHLQLPLQLATWDELRWRSAVADVSGLPLVNDAGFGPHSPILWVESYDIVSDRPTWVPHELVHTNYTLPLPSGSGVFLATSNGLASGNHLVEALVHGITEVIERDATALFEISPAEQQEARRIDLSSVRDERCARLLDRFAAAGVAVAVWETTSDIGVPAFRCIIAEAEENPFHLVHSAGGMGCHPTREIALMRALTEAAQSRLTVIAGSRDDVTREAYETARSPESLREDRRHVAIPGTRSFEEAPTFDASTSNADLAHLLERITAVGLGQVLVVDLSRAEFGIPVARVVIPGLEGPTEIEGWSPGRRAKAVLAGDNPS